MPLASPGETLTELNSATTQLPKNMTKPLGDAQWSL